MASANHMKAPTRIITTHDSEGKAVFSTAIPDQPTAQTVANGDATFYLSYATDQYPVDLNEDKDLKTYQKYTANPPGIVIGSGTVLRHVDMAPGVLSAMHRTVSLDYGIVIEGEIELVLDSGEKRRMLPGDVAIQRGTMHAWRNMSDTKWARMLYVLQPSEPLKIGDNALGEDYGGKMDGVRSSS